MAPVLDALDAVSNVTIEQQPSTAYQMAFHAGLAPRIQKALAAFRQAISRGLSSAADAQGILEQITLCSRAALQVCSPRLEGNALGFCNMTFAAGSSMSNVQSLYLYCSELL